jgi:putative endonuclease
MHSTAPAVIPTEGPRTCGHICHFDRRPASGGPKRRNLAQQGILPYNDAMPGSKTYYVYILANQSRTLYVGFTNNIRRRVWEHKTGLIEGFTHRYKIDTLVYLESFGDVSCGIAREKQIKRWSRDKKLRLIAQDNPDWRDLSDGSYG